MKNKENKTRELFFVIGGQISAGKNSIGYNRRTGRRYPTSKTFIEWRGNAISVMELVRRRELEGETIAAPVDVEVTCQFGDRRVRDIPSLLDGVFHCLERSGILKNDSQVMLCVCKKILGDKGTAAWTSVRIKW